MDLIYYLKLFSILILAQLMIRIVNCYTIKYHKVQEFKNFYNNKRRKKYGN